MSGDASVLVDDSHHNAGTSTSTSRRNTKVFFALCLGLATISSVVHVNVVKQYVSVEGEPSHQTLKGTTTPGGEYEDEYEAITSNTTEHGTASISIPVPVSISQGTKTGLVVDVDVDQPQPTKHILFYHKGPANANASNYQSIIPEKCPTQNCVFTDDRNYLGIGNLSLFDAVIFGVTKHTLLTPEEVQEVNSWRRPHQKFVMTTHQNFMMRLRQRFPKLDPMFTDFFNWTMTYRWDSDIPSPHGWFEPKDEYNTSPLRPPESWNTVFEEEDFIHRVLPNKTWEFKALARRPHKVAWLVSHCDTESGREHYVEELSKYIQVDIQGKCANKMKKMNNKQALLKCEKGYTPQNKLDNCTRVIRDQYKFYLSFENSLCKDYVTEKFFRMVPHTIPIVMGQANYSNLAPPHSFINVLDYESPKALAEYLHELDRNHSKYLSYFWWKDHYTLRFGDGGAHHCELCRRLHHHDHDQGQQQQQQQQQQETQKQKKHREQVSAPLTRHVELDLLFSKDSTKSYGDMFHWLVELGECNRNGPPTYLNKSGLPA
jgi:alpha-1,3-fucosyltransferase